MLSSGVRRGGMLASTTSSGLNVETQMGALKRAKMGLLRMSRGSERRVLPTHGAGAFSSGKEGAEQSQGTTVQDLDTLLQHSTSLSR